MEKKFKKTCYEHTRRAGKWLAGLVYPTTCPVCQRIVEPEQLICPDCEQRLEVIEEPVCKKCGQPLDYEETEYCFDCSRHQHEYECGRAVWLYYGEMKQSLYRFKYSNKREYARYYGTVAWDRYEEWIRQLNIEAIIPVPLHRARQRRRGYNQEDLFARVLGEKLCVPVCNNLVYRTVNTRPQKELDDTGRKNNLKKAFKIKANHVQLRSILIVDDIYTTGCTIDAVAKEFKSAGVDHIYFLCISIGRGY